MASKMQTLLLWSLHVVSGNDVDSMIQHSLAAVSSLTKSEQVALRAVTGEGEARAEFYVAHGAHKCVTHIGSPEECQAAAQALGLVWDGIRDWGSRYRGCLKDTLSHDVYFNNMGDRDTLEGVMRGQVAVCHSTNFSAYTLKSGKVRCMTTIGSSDECEAAAQALGLDFDEDRDWTDRHRGCLKDTNGRYVNFNKQGDGDSMMGITGGQVALCYAEPGAPIATPAPSPTTQVVSISMMVEGVDYNGLVADAYALESLRNATAVGIAEAVGVPQEHVEVQLSEGSVRVDATITPTVTSTFVATATSLEDVILNHDVGVEHIVETKVLAASLGEAVTGDIKVTGLTSRIIEV